MTDHTDLIARLKRFDCSSEDGPCEDKDGYWVRFDDAADAIEALRAKNERLRAHLQELQEILPPVLETARDNSFAAQSEYSHSRADDEGYKKEREDIDRALAALAGKE